MSLNLSLSLLFAVLFLSQPGAAVLYRPAAEKKMNAEVLAQRHLESIGSDEARAAARTRSMNGTAQVIFRLGNRGQLAGNATVLSDARRLRLGMSFAHQEYPGEQLAYDGKKVTTGLIKPGLRSNLSKFVYEYDFLLKEGLIGGTLSASWCLLDLSGRKPKLRYTGLKNIEGRELHELRYQPRKNPGGFQIMLYFEPDTYRHAASAYQLKVPAYMAHTPEESPGQVDDYYTIREEFGDYHAVDSLMLPRSYKLVYTYRGQQQTFLSEWNIQFTAAAHNEEIDPKYFTIQ